jgi:AcrR family transcriptional regulator
MLAPRSQPPAPRPRRPRRSPTGYARGDETRARIINAALDVFGVHGFGGASTRMLADRAGVNLPALQYYFNGKEGVYLACAEHIAGRMQQLLGPAAARMAARLEAGGSPRRLRAALLEFLDGFANLFLAVHEQEHWVLFIIREQAHPTKAFDILYERMMRRVIGACTGLVARLLGLSRDDPAVRLRTLALLGQIVFFRTAREVTLRTLQWPDFDGDRLSVAKDALMAQIAASLVKVRAAPATAARAERRRR